MSTEAQTRIARLRTLPFESAGAPVGGVLSGFLPAVRDVWRHRSLLDLLIRRELKARYKDSALGFVWSFVRPIVMLLIYYVAIGQFLGAARGTAQYAIFVFSGLTLWGLYNEIIAGGTMSILGNAGLIKKVYVPRELFPLAAMGSAVFNFVMQMGVLVAATIVTLQFPWSWNILYVPAAFAVTLIYGTLFALVLSALNVYLRDIQYLVEVALLILFWASPIVYPWATVHRFFADGGHSVLEFIYLLNPMTDAILAFQKGMWIAGSRTNVIDGTTIAPVPWPDSLDIRLLLFGLVGMVLIVLAQRLFSRLQGNFAQEI